MLTAVLMLGCARTTAVYRSPADALAEGQGKPMELRLVTGQRYTIRDGRMQNDTLYAVSLGRTTAENVPLAIPSGAIVSLATTERSLSVADAAKFTLGTVAIAAMLGALALIAALSSIQ